LIRIYAVTKSIIKIWAIILTNLNAINTETLNDCVYISWATASWSTCAIAVMPGRRTVASIRTIIPEEITMTNAGS
jgi:hypothetical protein